VCVVLGSYSLLAPIAMYLFECQVRLEGEKECESDQL